MRKSDQRWAEELAHKQREKEQRQLEELRQQEREELLAQLRQQPARVCPICKLVKPATDFVVYHPFLGGGYWQESRQCQPCYQTIRERSYPTCCLCAQKKPLSHFNGLHWYSTAVDGRGISPCCASCTDAFLALPEKEQRQHIRLSADQRFPSEQVIYGLLDPTTQEVRYIGRTGDLGERYKAHLKGRTPTRSPNPYTITPNQQEWYSKNNWIQDLFDEGLKPIPTILQKVKSGPLVVEWEGRFVAHGIQQGWPLLNAEIAVVKFTSRIQASKLDFLRVPFDEWVACFRSCPPYPWYAPSGFAAFIRAWYVDERDTLPEAS